MTYGFSAAGICTNKNNGVNSLLGSSLDSEVQYIEVADKEVFMSHPGIITSHLDALYEPFSPSCRDKEEELFYVVEKG